MIELVKGDSFELIKRVPDSSVQLVMTDVPYPDMKIHDGSKNIIMADRWIEWFAPMATHIKRILTDKGSFVTTINSKSDRGFYMDWVSWMKRELGFNYVLTFYWVKRNIIPGSIAKMHFPRDGVDFIAWFSKTKKYYSDLTQVEDWSVYNPSTHVPTNLIYGSVKDDKTYWKARKETGVDHAGKYPELIPDCFIRILTMPEDTILEPFSGTGTTALVASRLNRHCVAFETNLNNLKLSRKCFNAEDAKYFSYYQQGWKWKS